RPTAEKVVSFSVLTPEEVRRAKAMEGTPYPDPPRHPRSVHWKIDRPLPKSPILKGWEFDGNSLDEWTASQFEKIMVQKGVFSATVTGSDPQLIVDNVGVKIEDVSCIGLRLRISTGVSACEVFWSTVAKPDLSARKAFHFPLKDDDGEWHTYLVSKDVEGAWRGMLKLLRFDFGAPGDRIDVDWIRLYGLPPSGAKAQ
ncbi:MAG: hypothetical protein KAI66_18740, partial [Lentisphaeria bacterium]|nr:hypothetical protein [Lentisphaeria bacterium]